MAHKIKSVIVGTGKYVPESIVKNEDFLQHTFFEKDGSPVLRDNSEVISKFQSITEIEERRYAANDQNTSDLAFLAAKDALNSSGVDPETLDYIIVAHNFGDINYGSNRSEMVPTLASRVKHKLQIQNPNCVAYDLPFGCPGWLQGMIQADYYIRSGDAQKVLIIGSEAISRITDQHDRDSMIYADGAGATILAASTEENVGILSHLAQTHSLNEAWFLRMECSFKQDAVAPDNLYLKMDGRKVYEYALTHVPLVIKAAVDKSGIPLEKIKKILVHQANGKMDEAILKRFFRLYGIATPPEGVMPMTIAKFGNSSVATIPTLLDKILKNEMDGHRIEKDDAIVFVSVGAGMNINAMVYQY